MFLFRFLKTSDWLALICAEILGFLAGHFVAPGWSSTYTSILISYHLFLAWLLATADNEVETLRPLSYSMSIHAACLASLIFVGMGRLFVRNFDIVGGGVVILAFFERNWLFQPVGTPPMDDENDTVVSSAEEYQEWLKHIAENGADSGHPERSRKEEFEWWLQARRASHTASSAGSGSQTH